MTLGWQPKYEQIVLTRDQDFIFSREARNVSLPVGTTARIQWTLADGSAVHWYGTVSGNTASWKVEAAETLAIPNGAKFRIFVSYPGATDNRDDYVWMRGQCRRIENG